MDQREIFVRSSLDGSMQPALFYQSPSEEKRPLLVGLHTWSFDRFNQIDNMLPYAQKLDFHLLLPEFRGPNLTGNPRCKEACASGYACQDVKDAIDEVTKLQNVDSDSIYLLGASGGGHMALMMCAHQPELFRAVGAFVPITDLCRWTEENSSYRDHVMACCSGSHDEMAARSPIHHLDAISRANVKLFHGRYDPVVPVSHSIDFFMQMMKSHPSARIYLDIFDGGHEMDMETAMRWLLSQHGRSDPDYVTGKFFSTPFPEFSIL